MEQYKKSKQASYEVMQEQWNIAVNELRDVKAENERLQEKYNAALKNNANITELQLKKIEEIAYTTDFDIVDIQEIVAGSDIIKLWI